MQVYTQHQVGLSVISISIYCIQQGLLSKATYNKCIFQKKEKHQFFNVCTIRMFIVTIASLFNPFLIYNSYPGLDAVHTCLSRAALYSWVTVQSSRVTVACCQVPGESSSLDPGSQVHEAPWRLTSHSVPRSSPPSTMSSTSSSCSSSGETSPEDAPRGGGTIRVFLPNKQRTVVSCFTGSALAT